MSKKLMLMHDVEGLGSQGDEVVVADGYARNYLIPKGLAAPVTPGALKRLETLRRKREEEMQARLEEARQMVEKLEAVSCTIAMRAGEGDRLYGSVGPQEIAEALAAEGIEIDRNAVHLDEPIKELGVFKAEIRLHPEVTTTIKIWVVGE